MVASDQRGVGGAEESPANREAAIPPRRRYAGALEQGKRSSARAEEHEPTANAEIVCFMQTRTPKRQVRSSRLSDRTS
jgi:hypothetical protein